MAYEIIQLRASGPVLLGSTDLGFNIRMLNPNIDEAITWPGGARPPEVCACYM
jgi:hypothetical protein